MASPTTTDLPSRATTGFSTVSEDAIPEVDPSSTAGLLAERLQAWKHAVGYIEEYMKAMEKIHGHHAKEYERALKAINNPLKEGHHFDQSLGGVAGFFENMRSNTQSLINTNIETEKSIKGSVLPVLERLHKEIKHKAKELAHGAEKGAKEVDKARNTTQKQIELLGQHAASFDSAGGHLSSHDDPYVVYRGVLHRLNSQVIAENNHRNDLIAVQNNFQSFEAHIIEVVQQAMEAFTQLAGGQADKTRALYNDQLSVIQRVTPDFEWNAFKARSADRLVDPNEPARSVDAIQFPNMDHVATKALIEGSLERKSRNKLSWGYSTGYYVVTPSKFLHEFKDSDNNRQDPKPELSIYLPDAVIGTVQGEKLSVKGKDKSKTMSSKLTGSTELNFKAHTAADAQKWFQVLAECGKSTAPLSTGSSPAGSTPTSPNPQVTADPIDAKVQSPVTPVTPAAEHGAQEAGIVGGEAPAAAAAPAPVAAPAAAEKKETAI
ncbi:transcription factor Ask10p [Fusarium tjaetaba]|uniref:Transcription factor Ask10p n=1 Tax=Fusarium tjaetaba TaxID=1567544 RepID=A0A8H5RQD9_9HYPO|nr:transcription factor Ask10p [Fusarium tjaetaba]KAF5639026.1 transcription factor Ask10p [Fusarium tjaetaba]